MASLKNHIGKTIIFLLFIVASVPSMIMGVNNPGGMDPLTTLLPGGGMVQFGLIIIIIIIEFLVGGIVFEYLLAPLFMRVLKMSVGKGHTFGFQDRPHPEKYQHTWRAFFAALFAINLAMIVASQPAAVAFLVHPDNGYVIGTTPGIRPLIAFFVALIFTCPASIAVFAPTWLLVDSGLVYTNKVKVDKSGDPIQVRGGGDWYEAFLKGYTGISAVISYYQFGAAMLFAYGGDPAVIPALIFVPAFPFFITIYVFPLLIVQDIRLEKQRDYIKKKAEKFGISRMFQDPFV